VDVSLLGRNLGEVSGWYHVLNDQQQRMGQLWVTLRRHLPRQGGDGVNHHTQGGHERSDEEDESRKGGDDNHQEGEDRDGPGLGQDSSASEDDDNSGDDIVFSRADMKKVQSEDIHASLEKLAEANKGQDLRNEPQAADSSNDAEASAAGVAIDQMSPEAVMSLPEVNKRLGDLHSLALAEGAPPGVVDWLGRAFTAPHSLQPAELATSPRHSLERSGGDYDNYGNSSGGRSVHLDHEVRRSGSDQAWDISALVRASLNLEGGGGSSFGEFAASPRSPDSGEGRGLAAVLMSLDNVQGRLSRMLRGDDPNGSDEDADDDHGGGGAIAAEGIAVLADDGQVAAEISELIPEVTKGTEAEFNVIEGEAGVNEETATDEQTELPEGAAELHEDLPEEPTSRGPTATDTTAMPNEDDVASTAEQAVEQHEAAALELHGAPPENSLEEIETPERPILDSQSQVDTFSPEKVADSQGVEHADVAAPMVCTKCGVSHPMKPCAPTIPSTPIAEDEEKAPPAFEVVASVASEAIPAEPLEALPLETDKGSAEAEVDAAVDSAVDVDVEESYREGVAVATTEVQQCDSEAELVQPQIVDASMREETNQDAFSEEVDEESICNEGVGTPTSMPTRLAPQLPQPTEEAAQSASEDSDVLLTPSSGEEVSDDHDATHTVEGASASLRSMAVSAEATGDTPGPIVTFEDEHLVRDEGAANNEVESNGLLFDDRSREPEASDDYRMESGQWSSEHSRLPSYASAHEDESPEEAPQPLDVTVDSGDSGDSVVEDGEDDLAGDVGRPKPMSEESPITGRPPLSTVRLAVRY
jgi:hypothetical protein